ncbi:MAG: DUF1844 domain-containing protein [Armatimonadetes bacterium]|nr:DUF1844 domain-containing protein [Armatimonadota bacterium]
MEDGEDKGFEVVDKRSSREAVRDSSDSEEEEAPAKTQQEAEAREEQPEPGKEEAAGDVYSLIEWIILMLSESAWQWMGLHPNPATRKVEQDLAQARIAIDSVVFLSDQVAPHISEEQRKAYRSLISDLRVNFVQQQTRASQAGATG